MPTATRFLLDLGEDSDQALLFDSVFSHNRPKNIRPT
jgi:hypothetical protein